MKLKQMTCQNCGGTIELDFDHLISYCPYCGSKLMIDIANIDEVLKEREKTKRIRIKNESDNLKNNNRTNLVKLYLLIWIISLMVFGIMSIFTLDDANFSPYQLLLICDLIGGFIAIKRLFFKQ